LAEEMQQELEDEELIDLFLGLGRFHEGKGLYSEAKDWYEKCRLAAEERNLAKEHPGVIQTLNALADVNQSLYLYRESASCYLKAYKRGRKRLERLAKSGNATNEDWINFAQTIDGLGYLYLDWIPEQCDKSKRLEKAKSLLEKALEIRVKLAKHADINEQQHFDVELSIALSWDNLAYYYRLQEAWQQSEQYYQNALEKRKELLSNKCLKEQPKEYLEEYPILVESAHNLGVFYDDLARFYERQKKAQAQQEYAKAVEQYTEALEACKKLHGENHFKVATISRKLARVYSKLGQNAAAENLYKNTLEITKPLLGNHLDVAVDLKNLASFYFQQGRYDDAQIQCNEAFSIIEILRKDRNSLDITEEIDAVYNTLTKILKSSSKESV
jgi:tetratricopeptide (TPR) repeat protein